MALRWGLVGTSGFAAFACVPGIGQSATGRLTAVASSSAERGGQFAREHGIDGAVTDVGELAARDDVDAVWVASPTHLHHAHAKAVLSAGKHVLVEKPLALDVDEARELVDRAAAAQRVLAIGYQARAVPIHNEMLRLIHAGALGEIYSARTWYATPAPPRMPDWKKARRTAGWGVLGDTATHHIDLIRMLLGDVVGGQATIAFPRGLETEDVACVNLTLASGSVASISATRNLAVAGTRVEIHGTSGSLTAVDTSPRGGGCAELITADGTHPIDVAQPLSWAALVDAVGTAVEGGPSPHATGADGLRGVEILAELLDSAVTST